MMLSETALAAAKAHAVAEFPKEACGLVVAGEYIPCVNQADDPTKDFAIDSALVAKYMLTSKVDAILHSHPFPQLDARSTPSAADMRGQVSTNVPWGIIDTDGEVVNDPYWLTDANLDTPLIGMQFHHGVFDCYTAVRKWFWQKRGIKLIEMPRDDLWWTKDESLYLANFEKAGWVQISVDSIRNGDVILGKVNSEVVNHAAVYLDNEEDGKGLIYHHLPGRLSRREPANPWVNRADVVLRYHAD